MIKEQTKINLKELCKKFNLDFNTINIHQLRIKDALIYQHKPYFKIIDTCRLDNGGILKPEYFNDFNIECLDNPGFVSFVPAAGASSRYFASASELLIALNDENISQIRIACKKLLEKNIIDKIIPKQLKDFIINADNMDFDLTYIQQIKSLLQQPKALFPCTLDDVTFLEMKLYENLSLSSIYAQVFIAPYNKKQSFYEIINSFYIKNNLKIPTQILEQGPELSTIRFDNKAQPILDKNLSLSIVPAGHGALINLFNDIQKLYPSCHSLFIRNIDNIIGIKEDVINATQEFLNIHSYMIKIIKKIRSLINTKQYNEAALCAKTNLENLCNQIPLYHNDNINIFLKHKQSTPFYWLWKIMCVIFHFDPNLISMLPIDNMRDENVLKFLYTRPINTMGQVPNINKDIGGTPCFVHFKDNTFIKLCLEVPHANTEDKNNFLSNSNKATHFNPVFVAAELDFPTNTYNDEHNMFWILSEKPYLDKKAYYHETVLYEILGNSLMANVLFVEIPRKLFNPHKTLENLTKLTSQDWGVQNFS